MDGCASLRAQGKLSLTEEENFVANCQRNFGGGWM
jgi:hypothetical protein